jgi:hypothetical protein
VTSLFLSVGLLLWGCLFLVGGGWAMYAGHRDRVDGAAPDDADRDAGGLGGYLLGGLILVLGAGLAGVGLVTLL